MSDLLASAAANMASWHRCSLHALGNTWVDHALMWQTFDSAPYIFLSGITLRPDDPQGQLALIDEMIERRPGPFAVSDAWSRLDLDSRGFEILYEAPWMARPPSRPDDRGTHPELSIERIEDEEGLAEFESVSIDAFDAPDLRDHGRLGVHAGGILNDPNMHVLCGRVGGRIVSVATAYVTDVVGVYGTGTLPGFRNRGFGGALTLAATAVAPELPAVLQPTEMSERLYRSLGFRDVGRFKTWLRL